MSGRVSLSAKHAKALLASYDAAAVARGPIELHQAFESLRYSLRPRAPKSMAVERKKAKRNARSEKNAITTAIYTAVSRRANGCCEACGSLFSPADPPELDHQAGRGRARQTFENCWLIHRSCHRAKRDSRPWLEAFIAHCCRQGYRAEAERARSRLEGIVSVREAAAVGVGK